ncbi:MAG: UDP-4-amino-4,6-dideoxy-N-acetyl-beta-L-altrosamine transaminase [Nitrospinae bacterium CG11_big_fil_rev_8_21_14_0_20_56_8]|nr:MAG: UDP-4-amino-4,6-dideoxy-N-acetyl-beta-L-altrosamine transaminase [Nitrospinae bacterium CG11_big_fil_rev_8_21_14_0_20_56_8]
MSIDLPFHRAWLDDDEINEVVDTLKSGWMTTGPKARQFEEDFQNYIGCRHAIALNSCTAGLHLAVAVSRFNEGDEIITTPMTFPATSNVLVHERLEPVFVDIEPGTLNLDASRIEAKITSRTRGILPVHFGGHPCDMDAIEDIAARHRLAIIEDAAHAIESRYKERKVGDRHLTAFSFYANKNITTGEGGMLTTNDDDIADTVRVLRLHGLSRDAWNRFGNAGYSHWELEMPGFKYNMADINAALGIHQLKKVERFLEIRKLHAERYDAAFGDVEELERMQTREYATTHAHYIYPVALRLERLKVTRDEFLNAVQETGIGVAVHYIGLHLQPFYRKTYALEPGDYPVATDYSQRLLSLPLYPKMTEADVDRVAGTVRDLVARFRR